MRWQAACIRQGPPISIPDSSIRTPVFHLDRLAPPPEICSRADHLRADLCQCQSAAAQSFQPGTHAHPETRAWSATNRLRRHRLRRRQQFRSPARLCWSRPAQRLCSRGTGASAATEAWNRNGINFGTGTLDASLRVGTRTKVQSKQWNRLLEFAQ